MRGDYTLAEVKEICEKKECHKCLFRLSRRKMCMFETAPQFWDLSKPPSKEKEENG